MATYEYACDKCEHYFTRRTSFDGMFDAEAEPCPQCAEVAVKKVIRSAPALGDSVRLGLRHPDNGFKDVLKKIHEATPGSRLDKNNKYM